jgi:lipoprotein-anchoring transpeptidase ErfK/SrfK
VHGTNRPELLPGAVSHGCIRMTKRAILKVAKLMPVDTPLTITLLPVPRSRLARP